MTITHSGFHLALSAATGFLGATLSLLLFTGQLVRAQDESTPGIIRAEEFQLVDLSGRTRALLTFSASGQPYLAMSDQQGNHSLWLGLSDDSGLAIRDTDGKTRLVLSLDRSGEPSLVVRDRGHNTRSFRPE